MGINGTGTQQPFTVTLQPGMRRNPSSTAKSHAGLRQATLITFGEGAKTARASFGAPILAGFLLTESLLNAARTRMHMVSGLMRRRWSDGREKFA